MNKSELIDYMSKQHNCTKTKAEEAINLFTGTVISVLGDEKTIELIGFGSFYTTKIEAKTGRNPRTQESMEIAAHFRPQFKAGQKLKDACNSAAVKKTLE
jgi:DNA-binding protein HU-beta